MSGPTYPHLSIPDEPGPACEYPRQDTSLVLPLSRQWPRLTLKVPMSAEEWGELLALLDVMRPGLVGAA